MDINKYALFVKAVETSNLSKAAAQLNYTQTAASHMLSSLEENLGVKLLYRGRKGVSLTEDGAQIYPLACELVKKEADIHELLSHKEIYRGNVRMGVITSIVVQWMPNIIKEFHKLYPYVNIQINDAINYEWIRDWFSKDEIDCAISADIGKSGGKEIPLIADPYYVIIPKGHPLCSYDKISPALLKGETFIIPSEGTNHSVGQILRQSKCHVIEPGGFLSDQSAIALVKSGYGISILPKLVLDSYSCDNLIRKELDPEVTRTIYLCLPTQKNIRPATRLFTNFICEAIAQTLKN